MKKNTQNDHKNSSFDTAVTVIARRLQSQPLLFGFGIFILLVAVAGSAVDTLKILQWPAIIIFSIGSAVWLIAEFLKFKSQQKTTDVTYKEQHYQARDGADLRVQAKKVGKSGSVSLVEGAPSDMKINSINADVEGIQGSVKGVVYQQEKQKHD